MCVHGRPAKEKRDGDVRRRIRGVPGPREAWRGGRAGEAKSRLDPGGHRCPSEGLGEGGGAAAWQVWGASTLGAGQEGEQVRNMQSPGRAAGSTCKGRGPFVRDQMLWNAGLGLPGWCAGRAGRGPGCCGDGRRGRRGAPSWQEARAGPPARTLASRLRSLIPTTPGQHGGLGDTSALRTAGFGLGLGNRAVLKIQNGSERSRAGALTPGMCPQSERLCRTSLSKESFQFFFFFFFVTFCVFIKAIFHQCYSVAPSQSQIYFLKSIWRSEVLHVA